MIQEKKTVSWRVCFFLPVSLFKLWQKVLLKCSSSMLLENFQKICRETTAMETILGRFKLFKMDSGKGVFLSVFRTPFYGCFQSLNVNAFLCTAWKLYKCEFLLVCIFPHSNCLCIQFECRKIRTRKNFVFGQFSRSVEW